MLSVEAVDYFLLLVEYEKDGYIFWRRYFHFDTPIKLVFKKPIVFRVYCGTTLSVNVKTFCVLILAQDHPCICGQSSVTDSTGWMFVQARHRRYRTYS